MIARFLLGLLLALPLISLPVASAATLPPGFDDTPVASVPQPTAFAFTPDGRMLVASKLGRLRVVRDGALLPGPALDLSARVCPESERGLLGVAVDPDFAASRRVYLYYTFKKFGTCALAAPPNGPVNRVSSFVLDGDAIDPASETVLIDGIPSTGGNHNGGQLQFGRDGRLYVSVGDGGCDYAGDSGCALANDAARDRNVLLGKVLRITADGGIPADNPFLGEGTARCNETGAAAPGQICQETYAWGLRNPFRLGFDTNAAGTRFLINDVGQSAWEEIDEGRPGADYGWNRREGHCAGGSTTDCGPPPAGVTNPIFDYGRGGGCGAITGGAFVPRGLWPAQYDGRYLFADYVCGKIQALRLASAGVTAEDFGTDMGPVIDLAFGPPETPRALYYLTFAGAVRRIAYTPNAAPVAVASAGPRSGGVPLSVVFNAHGSSDPERRPLDYEWDFGDGSTSTSAVAGHTYASAGTYSATLRVTDSAGATATDTVRIDAGNTAPVPRIDSPASDLRFRVGQPITLRGAATDAEDGPLSAFSLEWTVLLHHGTHTHPFLGPRPGNDIEFDAPPPESLEAAGSSYLELRLTATDSKGLEETVSQDLRPRTVGLFFKTEPDDLAFTVDGVPVRGGTGYVSWEGYRFEVRSPGLQGHDNKVYAFSSWSDGGAARHAVTTPAEPTAYVARFSQPKCGGGVGLGILLVMGCGAVTRRLRRH